MTNALCSVANCSSPVLARGWCSKHYQRWQDHGSVTWTPSPQRGCGTYAAYQRHRARRETACDTCRLAANEYHSQWRETHREKVRERERATYWADPEVARAKNRAKYRGRPEASRERDMAARRRNPEPYRTAQRKYRETHKEEIAATRKAVYWAQVEKSRAKLLAHRWANIERYRYLDREHHRKTARQRLKAEQENTA